jgi:hypothetical protein
MKIILFQCLYNELALLPYKLQYAKEQEFDAVYSLDNMSSDGSWEYLQANGCPGERFNTQGIFSLAKLNAQYTAAVHKLKPDWAVIAGMDMFYYVRRHRTLRSFIELADAQGFNTIDFAHIFNFFYTGDENDHFDPRTQYFFYKDKVDLPIQLAFKYHADLEIDGERLAAPNRQILQHDELVTLHYWLRSDWRQRKEAELARRTLAWEKKMDLIYWGAHYKSLVERQPDTWPKSELKDIRDTWIWNEYLTLLE